ncbi:MAG: transglutaminase family protein [Cellulomonadaceae bacterium]|jgi:transglutaminase-like putative cysteine protease|nr:transglutaminase family protein [Cellulomonadaceae bacterium]
MVDQQKQQQKPGLLKIVHSTQLTYSHVINASYNEARMKPVSDDRQKLRNFRLTIKPCTSRDDYTDFWGTATTAFESLGEHESLTVTAESTTAIQPTVPPQTQVGWDELRSDRVTDDYVAYLPTTSVTRIPHDVEVLARAAAQDLDPLAAAEAICQAVRDKLEYVPGATTVQTTATEAWNARRGVCQDMAHLAIGALRSVGIPARYVSGYLHPVADAPIGQTETGESHAWCEFWTGEWTGYDPTNRRFIGSDHVIVARGREYSDVPPLKGVYAGNATSDLAVTVKVTRLA